MNTVKTSFSIKDLESFGGIKAHTIRMWERRYNLLEPDRTETNIRTYSIGDLQKLLNVTFLLDHNYKISKIAKHSSKEIATLVSDIVEEDDMGTNHHAVNSFKIAMMNFDQKLFNRTYVTLKQSLSFREIFFKIFIPLLENIGLLWQSGVINPAHEHFISNLIKQKILINKELLENADRDGCEKMFILFLPENEIHDLGLMFLNYEIVAHGFKCVYLGQNIHIEDLKYLASTQQQPYFVSYLTVNPCETSVADFAKRFNKDIGRNNMPLYLLGRIIQTAKQSEMPENVKLIKSIDAFNTLLN
ncbi:B12 binding protein [Leeuwenhoekiella aestuarii]|uniref:B12 binding protein n=1 Tax=Leeuwenhoekiella aestuarii TaxID=2249426 RepID=A0A4Q0NXD2_9FLAO|nr:MerR family transcriptional regulator [Leeuwenhoekiella aestuarii]RXG16106.1 B12 binding protein [Leeuwenhoekiella aestuarii]RXG16800.1 B12 binding protein [Leeuwenhoekiella aestuarii]